MNKLNRGLGNINNPHMMKNHFHFTLTSMERKKYLSLISRKPIFLGFGEKASSEHEAIQKGFVKITSRDMKNNKQQLYILHRSDNNRSYWQKVR